MSAKYVSNKTILFITAAVAVVSVVVKAEDVLDLSAGDFKSAIGQHDTVLVEFFAPWCGHCKRLAPEYESAATALKNNDPPVPLAKVDCTSDGGKDICSEYGVSGYPTLKIFKGGEFASEYNGPRESDGIVKYMRSQVGPASRLVDTRKKLEDALNKAKDAIVLGVFEKDDSSADLQKKFLKTADKLRESVNFVHLFTSSVGDALALKQFAELKDLKAPTVLLVRPKDMKNKFEPNVVEYSAAGDDSIDDFIKTNYHGLVGFRTQNNNNDFKTPLVVVYYDVDYVKNPKGTNYWRNRVLKVAQNYRDLSFAVSNHLQFAGELEEFGLEAPKDRDAAPAVGARDSKGKKYGLKQKFSVESLEQFVKDLTDGKLEPYQKSEEVPTDNDSADVKVAVGKNFDDLVTKSDRDTLIEFYAPWCGHCKKLAPAFDELGKLLKDEPGVQVVKMDATANDVPETFVVHGFPTIYWYPKDKSGPKKYEGGREAQDFLQYIAKQSTNELAGYDRSGNKKETQKEEL
ncbi:protein disulfide-isomerase A3-like [Oppia nitens]|uniref:protein disulfide-isomerase A3-like n=1 Tax=Oppia nitens TaxID=1686743 RepID=UPI0023DC01D5|nr:protein disulfide-isomerase A3-like [Oppia nitens]XP_054158255.1 protein disulfide-isomerase A3-like [Oppia nitens]XP_054158256.1 protein disulfide-isomerase A3-like [Oppia nitens]